MPLSAAEKIKRGKELTPARLLALKLWEENPKITVPELDKALKEKGFEICKTTRVTWLTRFRKGSGVRTFEGKPDVKPGKQRITVKPLREPRKQRLGQKPNPARLLAFKLWEQNPKITAAELDKALKEEGFQLHRSTFYLWLNSFRKGKGVGTYEEKPVTAVEPGEITGKITLEQIIRAAGSIEALSLLFYQGVMEELRKRDSAFDVLKQDCLEKDEKIAQLKHELEDITRERNRIIREYNETMDKLKVGKLTLDQVEHRLIPQHRLIPRE